MSSAGLDSPARRTRSRTNSNASNDSGDVPQLAPVTRRRRASNASTGSRGSAARRGGVAATPGPRRTRRARVADATAAPAAGLPPKTPRRRTTAQAKRVPATAPTTRTRRRRASQGSAVSNEDGADARAQADSDDEGGEAAPAISASTASQDSSDGGAGAGAGAGAGSSSGGSSDGSAGGSSDSDGSSEEEDSDSDDPELDHLVAISGNAIRAYSAAAGAGRRSSAAPSSEPVDPMAAATAAASLTLAGSSDTFAGLRGGPKYIKFGSKAGIHSGARVASSHGATSLAPAPAVDSKTEKQDAAPLVDAKLKKRESKNTFGKKWFDLPSSRMTAAVKRDLQIVQMRNYLDPKHYYKASDSKTLPQQFQVGTVVEAAHEFKTSRLTKRQRKPTIADSLLADQSFRKYARRTYDAVSKKAKAGKGSNLRNKWWKR